MSEPILQTEEKIGKDYGDGLGLVWLDLRGQARRAGHARGPQRRREVHLPRAHQWTDRAHQRLGQGEHPTGSLEAHAATSYLPDNPVLYDDLSVWERIEYIARLHNTQEWGEIADDLLEMFNLTHRADDLPGTFSRGLKQKTGLILGLIRPFSLLLIDEPFAGLDGPGQETLVEVLGNIAEQGAAIVCSTHQLELLQVATR